VTSYGTLVSEYKREGLDTNPKKKPRKTKQGVFGRTWRRIVLDEAHTIRNPRAKVSLAAARLDSVTRWSLTGNTILFN
jgi:SWI/SNF-related matrix-associated actin-dependent regulator of chromatin subfamily A3